MASLGLLVSLLVVSELLIVRGDYTAELTRYTVSAIRHLARKSRGTFECVFLNMAGMDRSLDCLAFENVMQSPKLNHVVRYVAGGDLRGDPKRIPKDPSLVVIYAGNFYSSVGSMPRELMKTLFRFNSWTKMIILVDMLEGECFYVMDEVVRFLRLSKVAFIGSNRKMVIRSAKNGVSYDHIWEYFPNFEHLFVSNVRNMHGYKLTYTTIDPRYNSKDLNDLKTTLRWVQETAKFLNTTAVRVWNPCKELGFVLNKCLINFMDDNKVDASLDRMYLDAFSQLDFITLKIPENHVILVPRGQPLKVIDIFLAPLSKEAWIALIVIIASLEVLSFLLPSLFKNDPALFLICGLEKYDLHKASRWEKMIFLGFIIFFFLMTNAYETKIISMMTSKPAYRTIKTIQELISSGIPTKANFNSIRDVSFLPLNGTLVHSTDLLFNMDGSSAYLAQKSKADLYLPINYYDVYLERTSYVILDESLSMMIGAVLTSNHNPVQEFLEYSHNVLFEAGIVKYFTDFQETKAYLRHRCNNPNPEVMHDILLKMNDLVPAWIALGIGCAVSGVLLVGELLTPVAQRNWISMKQVVRVLAR